MPATHTLCKIAHRVRTSDGDKHNDHDEEQTSKEDCLLLYLLALEFKPKCVFEAGTYTGISSKFLAAGCGPLGGTVHTCDPYDYYVKSKEYDGFIKRYKMGAIGLSKELSDKDRKVDLAFIDADLPSSQIDHLLSTAEKDLVFVAREFYSGPRTLCRGAKQMDFAWKTLESKGYSLFVPDSSAHTYGHWNVILSNGNKIFVGIGGCSAVALPPSFELSP